MLSSGSTEDCSADFYGEPGHIIDAKSLKLLIKSNGHKMSSNAFDLLNLFFTRLIGLIGGETVRQSEGCINGHVGWTAVSGGVKVLLPSIEGWFSTWYDQLVKHVESAHPDVLPCKYHWFNKYIHLFSGDAVL